jgi:hypothetical protein
MRLREIHKLAPFTKEQIEVLLDTAKIGNYTINEDLSVDVEGNVTINGDVFLGAKEMPFSFRNVKGDFYIMNAPFDTMKGFPTNVEGSFQVFNCRMSTCEHAPKFIGTNIRFSLMRNLVSLKGLPNQANGIISINSNLMLPSIEGFPQKLGSGVTDIALSDCKNLLSLKGFPSSFAGSLNLAHCESLQSLQYLPPTLTYLNLSDCSSLHSLDYLSPTVNGRIMLGTNENLNKCAFKLFQIKGLQSVGPGATDQKTRSGMARKIINKYLKQPYGNKRWIECQSELIDAGYEDYAEVPE